MRLARAALAVSIGSAAVCIAALAVELTNHGSLALIGWVLTSLLLNGALIVINHSNLRDEKRDQEAQAWGTYMASMRDADQ